MLWETQTTKISEKNRNFIDKYWSHKSQSIGQKHLITVENDRKTPNFYSYGSHQVAGRNDGSKMTTTSHSM